LIDFIIGSIGLGMLFAAISLPFWIAFPQMFGSTNMNMPFSNLDGKVKEGEENGTSKNVPYLKD
jgi:hypothetical protein